MNTRKRTLFIALALLLSAATVGLAAAMMIPSVDELLVQSLETLEAVTDGHAVIEVSADLPEETVSGSFEVWGKLNVGPNGEPALRLEVLAASKADLVGVMAVADGTQFWLYSPNENTVVTGQAEDLASALAAKMAEHQGEWDGGGEFDGDAVDVPETPEEAVARLLEYFTAERAGSEEVAGTDAYVLRLVPVAEQMPDQVRVAGGFINLWLRSSDQLPLAAEYAEGALGSGKIEATFVEINTGLEEAVFTFDIPEDAKVIEASELLGHLESLEHPAEPVEFEVLTPSELPDGAVAAETRQIGGAVVQRYELPGGQSFVVAQGSSMPLDAPAEATSAETVVVRGVEGTLFTNEAGTRTLLTWKEGDVSFLVAGDLTPEQAAAIAGSLQ